MTATHARRIEHGTASYRGRLRPSRTDVDIFRLTQACPACDTHVRRPGFLTAARAVLGPVGSGLPYRERIGPLVLAYLAEYHDGHHEPTRQSCAIAVQLAALPRRRLVTWPVGLAMGLTRDYLRRLGQP